MGGSELDLSGTGQVPLTGSQKRENEILGFIKSKEIKKLEQLRDY
jgi:hypothetical protein